LVSLAWSGILKLLSASGALPVMVFDAGGGSLFAGGLFASVDSAGGGGGAAASTVGITEVVRGAPVVISGAGCCAVAVDDFGGWFGFEALALGNGLAGVDDGATEAGCEAATVGADGGGCLFVAGGRCGLDAAAAGIGFEGAAVGVAAGGVDARGVVGAVTVGAGGAVDLAISGCVDLGCGGGAGDICGWLAASLRKQRQVPAGPPLGDSFSPERKNSPSCGTINPSLLN
jgi:hypothetical protein